MVVVSDQRQSGDATDEQRFIEAGAALCDAVDADIEAWVINAVIQRAPAELDAALVAAAECRSVIVPRLRALVTQDADRQPTTPLQILRGAIVYPTAVLRTAGVTPVRRDQLDIDRDPEDVYGLTPAAFADFGPAVGESGLVWGAAKAYLHLAARRAAAEGHQP